MAIKEQINQFNGGLNLEANPLLITNTTLSDALNATVRSFNGNEYTLQNDLGNGRVHNARLKPGFIPIGMKEYGGVVYIASHNPISGESELGTFPSPERNLNWDNNQGLKQTINVKQWFNQDGGCKKLEDGFDDQYYLEGNIISGPKGQVIALKDKNSKDVLVHPGDLFKLHLTTNEQEYRQFSNYLNADDTNLESKEELSGPKSNYYYMVSKGAIKPINLDITVRNNLGNVEYITKDLLDNNNLLNKVINFSEYDPSNDIQENTKTREEQLDEYRKLIDSKGYTIYSGKNTGYLNFAVSLNTLKNFSVASSYIYDIIPEKKGVHNSYNSYTLIFKVYCDSKYIKRHYDSNKFGNNKWLFLEQVAQTIYSDIHTYVFTENNTLDPSKSDYKQKVLSVIYKDPNMNWEDVHESYKSDDLFIIYTVPDVFYATDLKGKLLENSVEEVVWNITPKSTIAWECNNRKSGKINIKSLSENNKSFTLKEWNYRTNYDSSKPLELYFGYEGSMDENILNSVDKVLISFYDVYYNRYCNFGMEMKNNGNNFSSYLLQIPYLQLGSSGPLDLKSQDPIILDRINSNSPKSDVKYYYNSTQSGNGYGIEKNKSLSKQLTSATKEQTVSVNNLKNTWGFTPLIQGNLYLCKIELLDKREKILNTDYRFLYTAPVFDDNSELDFKDLKPDLSNITIEDQLLSLEKEGFMYQQKSSFGSSLKNPEDQEFNVEGKIEGTINAHIKLTVPEIPFGNVVLNDPKFKVEYQNKQLESKSIKYSNNIINLIQPLQVYSDTFKSKATKLESEIHYTTPKFQDLLANKIQYDNFIQGEAFSDYGKGSEVKELKLVQSEIPNDTKFLRSSTSSREIKVEFFNTGGTFKDTVRTVASNVGLTPYIFRQFPDINNSVYWFSVGTERWGGGDNNGLHKEFAIVKGNTVVKTLVNHEGLHFPDAIDQNLTKDNLYPALFSFQGQVVAFRHLFDIEKLRASNTDLFKGMFVKKKSPLVYYGIPHQNPGINSVTIRLYTTFQIDSSNIELHQKTLKEMKDLLPDMNYNNIDYNQDIITYKDISVSTSDKEAKKILIVFEDKIIEHVDTVMENMYVYYEDKVRSKKEFETLVTTRFTLPQAANYWSKIENFRKLGNKYKFNDHLYLWTPLLFDYVDGKLTFSQNILDYVFLSHLNSGIMTAQTEVEFKRILHDFLSSFEDTLISNKDRKISSKALYTLLPLFIDNPRIGIETF